MTKIEQEVEDAVHDCWSVIVDIEKVLKYSEHIPQDMESLTDVYNIKFKSLMDSLDEMIDELHNVRATYDELKPVFDGKTEKDNVTTLYQIDGGHSIPNEDGQLNLFVLDEELL